MKKLLILLLALILLAGGVCVYLIKGRGTTELSTTYDNFRIIYEDEVLPQESVQRLDGQFYMTMDAIKEYFDENITYNEMENAVHLQNDAGDLVMPLDNNEAMKNGKKIGLRDPLFQEGDNIFIPLEAFIHDYPVKMRYNKDQNVLVMDSKLKEFASGHPSGDGVNLREGPSTNTPVVKVLNQGDQLNIYKEEDGWYSVREKFGYQGYVRGDNLEVELLDGEIVREKDSLTSAISKPINMTWDYTYNTVSDETISEIEKVEGLDIIVPTWFSVNADGSIIDRGKPGYVSAYKNFGTDTWGYVDNQFDADLTHEFLSNPEARAKAVSKLLELVKGYGMTGINIDFEQTKIEDRDNITSFVQEIYDAFHPEGLIVSVDVTPQISSDVEKEPYHRKELADACDYVVLMTYDQHWSSSEVAGSVAEYSWVEGNINLSLRDIPNEKFLLGIPFYSRIWTEGSENVDSRTASMSDTMDFIEKHDLTLHWDDQAKQNYVETENNGNVQKLWIENAESIEWRVSLMRKYNLAGIASWRKDFETPGIWSVIQDQMNHYNYLYE